MAEGTTFTIKLNADSSQALLQLASFVRGAEAAGKALLAIGAGAIGLVGFESSVGQVLRLGSELEKLKASTGGAIPDLITIQRMLRETGGAADGAETMLKRMEKAVVDAGEGG